MKPMKKGEILIGCCVAVMLLLYENRKKKKKRTAISINLILASNISHNSVPYASQQPKPEHPRFTVINHLRLPILQTNDLQTVFSELVSEESRSFVAEEVNILEQALYVVNLVQWGGRRSLRGGLRLPCKREIGGFVS